MKIAITAAAPRLDAPVDSRFGRGAYFIIVEGGGSRAWQAYENQAVNAAGGAGSQAAQFIARQGAGAVISGDFGPNAYLALEAAGIKMFLLGDSKTVAEIISDFNAGKLAQVHAATGEGHHGGRA